MCRERVGREGIQWEKVNPKQVRKGGAKGGWSVRGGRAERMGREGMGREGMGRSTDALAHKRTRRQQPGDALSSRAQGTAPRARVHPWVFSVR